MPSRARRGCGPTRVARPTRPALPRSRAARRCAPRRRRAVPACAAATPCGRASPVSSARCSSSAASRRASARWSCGRARASAQRQPDTIGLVVCNRVITSPHRARSARAASNSPRCRRSRPRASSSQAPENAASSAGSRSICFDGRGDVVELRTLDQRLDRPAQQRRRGEHQLVVADEAERRAQIGLDRAQVAAQALDQRAQPGGPDEAVHRAAPARRRAHRVRRRQRAVELAEVGQRSGGLRPPCVGVLTGHQLRAVQARDGQRCHVGGRFDPADRAAGQQRRHQAGRAPVAVGEPVEPRPVAFEVVDAPRIVRDHPGAEHLEAACGLGVAVAELAQRAVDLGERGVPVPAEHPRLDQVERDLARGRADRRSVAARGPGRRPRCGRARSTRRGRARDRPCHDRPRGGGSATHRCR